MKDTDVTDVSHGIYSRRHGIGGLEFNSSRLLEGLVRIQFLGATGSDSGGGLGICNSPTT